MKAERALRIGTRASALARAQTTRVVDALRARDPGIRIEEIAIVAAGDRDVSLPIGEGIFVGELRRALLAGEIDLAVHSLKDVPTEPVPGVHIAAIAERDDPRDCMIGATLAGAAHGARVGTSSGRRTGQLRAARPDLEAVPMRGNVVSRIAAVERGDVDAAILAVAGLRRLGAPIRGEIFDPSSFVPAPGQGALALETRIDDGHATALARAIDDRDARHAVEAERAVLAALGGGCQLPVGAFASIAGPSVRIHARVVSADGAREVRADAIGARDDRMRLAAALAEQLRARGAGRLLENGARVPAGPRHADAHDAEAHDAETHDAETHDAGARDAGARRA